MTDKPISFRICDFSEQMTHKIDEPYKPLIYSAVMHVDGEVYQYRLALQREFLPPMAALRSEAWLVLLEKVAAAKTR
jgi:hypothetical protein